MQDVDEILLKNGWIRMNLSLLSNETPKFLPISMQSTEKSMINWHQSDPILTSFENHWEWSENVPTLVDPLKMMH